MSDTGKIVLAILGTGVVVLIGVAAFGGGSAAPASGFTPEPVGPAAPPAQGDAGTAAVTGGFSLANTFLHDFMVNRDRQADRDAAAARDGVGSGKAGGGDSGGIFSWTQADRDRSAADLAAKNGSVNPR